MGKQAFRCRVVTTSATVPTETVEGASRLELGIVTEGCKMVGYDQIAAPAGAMRFSHASYAHMNNLNKLQEFAAPAVC